MAGRHGLGKPKFPSSSAGDNSTYDVFLSFRGEDTRKTFTDHLYTSLVDAGFQTFRDDEGIERGEDVTTELENAIRDSRGSIIVFSKEYASSRWCLNELVLILEYRRISDHFVLPVFYDVDPSQVRRQKGSFEKAFKGHERKYSKADVRKWRFALEEAADFAGMVLKNQEDGHESKFISKIVRVIKEKLHRTISILPPHLIGIESRAGSLNHWVRDQSNAARIAAICGTGGIGKTTIAKYVFRMNHGRFEGHSFLENIRETSSLSDGLVRLQKQLLADIVKGKKEKIRSVDEGILKIQRALCSKRIFIVLDDVDHIDQINAIFGMRNWLHPGSKIIITTRYEHLLRACKSYNYFHELGTSEVAADGGREICRIFNVSVLNREESSFLFNLYAFGQVHPKEGYEMEANKIVNYCGGLPLALIVLGRSLNGELSHIVWKSMAEKLEAIPDGEIMEKLKISYDSLQDDHDRELFLHIACFFQGKDKDMVVEILDECEFYTLIGIENLVHRSILSIDENNKLHMHQLLRQMGTEIVRRQCTKDPGKRSRLWRPTDAIKVLREKRGTETVEGFLLDMHSFKKNASNTQYQHKDEMWLEADGFTGMQRLMLLQLKHVHMTGSYENFPRTIKWLSWIGFPYESMSDQLPLDSVGVLDMRHSNLKQLWAEENKFLQSLKVLDLRHSHRLTNTPDFSWLPNLKRLDLEDCTCLAEIHESIGHLYDLVFLNLKECKSLSGLPTSISKLKFLETLDISGCTNIKHLADMSELESLKVFRADRLPINQLFLASNSTRHARFHSPDEIMSSPIVIDPRQRTEFPSWCFLPGGLVSLSLSNCRLSEDDFPTDFTRFLSLKDLALRENLFKSLPDFIRHLKLETLDFRRCPNLESLERLPEVENLDVDYCKSLKKITYQSTGFSSEAIAYLSCESLVEIGSWFKLEPLDSVDMEIKRDLGLNDMEFARNGEVILTNMYSFPCKFSLQGLHERGGFFSAFVPSEEIPGCFTQRCDGDSVCLSVPVVCERRSVRGLNICAVWSHPIINTEDEVLQRISFHIQKAPFPRDLGPLFIKVENITKGLKWIYHPIFFGLSKNGDHTSWFCRWKFGDDVIMQEGDRICVSVLADDAFQVKRTGVSFVHEQDHGGVDELSHDQKANDGSCSWDSDVDVSRFCIRTGAVFFSWRRPPENLDWFSPDCSRVLFGDTREIPDNEAMDGGLRNDECIEHLVETNDSKNGTKVWKVLTFAIGVLLSMIWYWLSTTKSSSDTIYDKRLLFPT